MHGYDGLKKMKSDSRTAIRKHSLRHGRVVKGVGHLSHDEAIEAGGLKFHTPTGAL